MPSSDGHREGFPQFNAVLTNEFASVRLSVDLCGHTPRLRVEDLETGDAIYLDPLELASFCKVTEPDRADWLRVGQYRSDAAV